MNDVLKRIKTVAMCEALEFDFKVVKDRHDEFIEKVRQGKEHKLKFGDLKSYDVLQKCLLDSNTFVSVFSKVQKMPSFFLPRFDKLIKALNEYGDSIDNYTANQIAETVDFMKYVGLHNNYDLAGYWFLKYFSNRGFNRTKKECMAKSIQDYYEVLEGNQEIFGHENISLLLCNRFLAYGRLFDCEYDVFRLLLDNENVRKFGIYLYSKGYEYMDWNFDEMKLIADNFDILIPKIKYIFSNLGRNRFYDFLCFWRNNGVTVSEVEMFVKRLQTEKFNPKTLDSDVAYVNFLFGNKLKNVNMEWLGKKQRELLIYAILNNKKGFLRLVQENYSDFEILDDNSILLHTEVYKRIININALNIRNLREFSTVHDVYLDNFTKDTYTFDEFKALHNVSEAYAKVYNMLTLDRVDDRLRVIREVIRKQLLTMPFSDEELERIAKALSQKALSRWFSEDFSDIEDILPEDCLITFANWDIVEKFRNEIENAKDLHCIVRNRKYAATAKSLSDMKNKILKNDEDWLALKEEMQLCDDFIKSNKKAILHFVTAGNASIANAYYPCLSTEYKTAFFNIVKAEMAGKLKELKYLPGDLAKEIDFNVSESQETAWAENISTKEKNITIKECDGFEETMKLGETPQHTCMSYKNGQYRECLISNFDSNKKVLYGYIGGECVSRAILRLTKGSYTGKTGRIDEKLKFAEIGDNGEVLANSNYNNSEHMAVFLEKEYSAGINDAIKKEITKVLIKHAIKKAELLGVECLISEDYRGYAEDMALTSYSMYISRSKAGGQYLDSLGGQATTSSERTMKSTGVFTNRREENEQE